MHPLESWEALNTHLLNVGEKECLRLLAAERAGDRRLTFLLRIHSRLNKIRAQRERKELEIVARVKTETNND